MSLVILGGAIVAVVVYLFRRRLFGEDADVIKFDADAERRAKWKAEQALAEAEMTRKIEEFRKRKEKYNEMRAKLNDEAKRNSPTSATTINTAPNPVVVLPGLGGPEKPKS